MGHGQPNTMFSTATPRKKKTTFLPYDLLPTLLNRRFAMGVARAATPPSTHAIYSAQLSGYSGFTEYVLVFHKKLL